MKTRIDLGLFLNGIPVATAELKTDFTQSVDDAVDQYRFDRDPRPKGQGNAEPLLSFPNGALVHFAVSNMEVRMTTRLQGAGTTFLPFNRGDHGAAGNPPSPTPLPSGGGANPRTLTTTSPAPLPSRERGRGEALRASHRLFVGRHLGAG